MTVLMPYAHAQSAIASEGEDVHGLKDLSTTYS